MKHGKQLRLFLPDGSAAGPRYYELVNWTGQALNIPVSRIKDLTNGKWPEFERPGIYMVRGLSEEGHPRLYIGESENVGARVQGHPSSLGFEVTEILLFSSKDDNLTKSHVLWLEIQLIQRAVSAKRITVTNTKKPPLKLLSKAEEATMQEFIEHVELVAQTAGFAYFTETSAQPAAKSNGKVLFFTMPQKGLSARALRTDEGYLVLEGSEAALVASSTLSKGYSSQRDELIDKGVLAQEGDKLRFTVDAPFSSPSAAAAIIAGTPASGPVAWKDKDGKKLMEILAREQTDLAITAS
jgi:hypothetical protein